MKLTPSQVKNYISRGLRLVVDPGPTTEERKSVFDHFDNRCAYCGIEITIKSGDLDHLVASADGGLNHISNRVCSCKSCNATKRDLNWEEFLNGKCSEQEALKSRTERITQWQIKSGPLPVISESLLLTVKKEIKSAIDAFDSATDSIRKTLKNEGNERK